MGLSAARRGGDLFKAIGIEGAGAAPLHLLKVVRASNIAHKQQALQGFNIGTRGDHIDGDGHARVVVIAKLVQHRLGVFGDFVGHFFAELTLFPKLLPHGLDNIVGVAVGFGKDQRLGHLLPTWKDLPPFIPKGANDGTNLVRVDDRAIELFAAVGFVVVLGLPALSAGQALSPLDLLLPA